MTALTDLRVLIVEDHLDMAHTQALLLSRVDAITEVCTDPLRCVEVVESFRPHAVILDIGLPKVSGIELARRIRSDARVSPSPVLIASTGFHLQEIRNAAMDSGCDHYLLKPYPFETLAAILKPLKDALAKAS